MGRRSTPRASSEFPFFPQWRWNCGTWTSVGSLYLESIDALASYDDGNGARLLAGCSWNLHGFTEQIVVPDRASNGQEVVHFAVTASDAIDPSPVVSCVPPSGSVFPLGDTLVTCTATDAEGNQSSCSFTVSVHDKVRPR